MSKATDIWNDAEGQDLSDEQLMAYLEGRLSPEEARTIEATLSAEGMDSDALEGLQALGAEQTKQLQRRLDLELNQSLKRKKRSRREGPQTQRWTMIAIVLILVLVILGFVVIRMGRHYSD